MIDEEESVRLVAAAMLERLGYHVLTTSDDELGLRILEDHAGSVAAVLVDVALPGPGGEGLQRVVRERHPNLRIVVMSGYSEHETSERLGVTIASEGFLRKPFRFADLEAAMDAGT